MMGVDEATRRPRQEDAMRNATLADDGFAQQGPIRMYGVGDVEWEDLLAPLSPEDRDDEPCAEVLLLRNRPHDCRAQPACVVVRLGGRTGPGRRMHVDDAVRAIRAATTLAA
jgi:hypothetical protein